MCFKKEEIDIFLHEKEVMKEFNEEIICTEVSNVKKNQQEMLKLPGASSRSVLPSLGQNRH